MNRSRLHSAFSLLELVLVVAIIGVLMSLLLPAIQGLRVLARKGESSSQMFRVFQASQKYANINNGWLPGITGAGYLVQAHYEEEPDYRNISGIALNSDEARGCGADVGVRYDIIVDGGFLDAKFMISPGEPGHSYDGSETQREEYDTKKHSACRVNMYSYAMASLGLLWNQGEFEHKLVDDKGTADTSDDIYRSFPKKASFAFGRYEPTFLAWSANSASRAVFACDRNIGASPVDATNAISIWGLRQEIWQGHAQFSDGSNVWLRNHLLGDKSDEDDLLTNYGDQFGENAWDNLFVAQPQDSAGNTVAYEQVSDLQLRDDGTGASVDVLTGAAMIMGHDPTQTFGSFEGSDGEMYR